MVPFITLIIRFPRDRDLLVVAAGARFVVRLSAPLSPDEISLSVASLRRRFVMLVVLFLRSVHRTPCLSGVFAWLPQASFGGVAQVPSSTLPLFFVTERVSAVLACATVLPSPVGLTAPPRRLSSPSRLRVIPAVALLAALLVRWAAPAVALARGEG